MPYDASLLLTDIGIIGFISAFIVSLGIILGRKEEPVRSRRSDQPAVAREEFIGRAS